MDIGIHHWSRLVAGKKQCNGDSKNSTPDAYRKAEADPGPTEESMADRGAGVNSFYYTQDTREEIKVAPS